MKAWRKLIVVFSSTITVTLYTMTVAL
jgi:hypothetical protein